MLRCNTVFIKVVPLRRNLQRYWEKNLRKKAKQVHTLTAVKCEKIRAVKINICDLINIFMPFLFLCSSHTCKI